MSCQSLPEYDVLVQMAYWAHRNGICSPFGLRTITTNKRENETHFHGGIDVGVPFGTRFYIDKKLESITRLDYQEFNGQYILVNGKQYKCYILHLARVLIVKGNNVKYRYVGLANSTGSSTGDHFHFEIHELKKIGNTIVEEKVNPVFVFKDCGIADYTEVGVINEHGTKLYKVSPLKVHFQDPCPQPIKAKRLPGNERCPI